MKSIKYTPDAAEKLRILNKDISIRYGSDKAKLIVGAITKSIRGLATSEKQGPTVEGMFGVTSEYRYLFVSRNYVFYKIEPECIRIINIYNEKEDFMWQLFGIDTTPQETQDYWKE